jgi:predicted nucleic acid-binding protein
MGKHLLTDTGFWIALYDRADQFHHHANEQAKHMRNHTVLVPWPCLYEAISSRLIRRPDRVRFLKDVFQKFDIQPVNDLPYRDRALKVTIDEQHPFSLADNVIRLMLSDPGLRIKSFITYNSGDFADICYKKSIDLITTQYFRKR